MFKCRCSLSAVALLALVVPLGADDVRLEVPGSAPLSMQYLHSPTVSSRAWGSALSPNPRGGFNFVTSFYELNSRKPTEHVVVDLEKGVIAHEEDQPENWISSFGYQVQTRAPNGRIFFPLGEKVPTLSYYDPADERIHSLGPLLGTDKGDRLFYGRIVGPDGMVYLATHSYQNPTVVQLDPQTLKWRVLGKVGMPDRSVYCYPYTMAVDPPWVYVAIGKTPWELAAIHSETGESKVLMKREETDSWLVVGGGPHGVTAYYTTKRGQPDQKVEFFFCADGAVYPNTFANPYKVDPAALPFKARNAVQPQYPVENIPELNLEELNPDSQGVSRILWRAKKGEGDWRQTHVQVRHLTPVSVESLLSLPDGTLLGNVVQYHGFFRFNPADNACQHYGRFSISRGPRLWHDGKVFISGYPNSQFWVFDPARPWSVTGKADDMANNPRLLGHFDKFTATEYATFLAAGMGRIYFVGRRERTGTGIGLGYYDLASGGFAGHHRRLSNLDPRGLLVMDSLQRVVVTGGNIARPITTEPDDAPAGASEQLVLFDPDLNEVERLTIRPGLSAAGRLFAVPAAEDQIFAVIPSDKAVYRYDLKNRRLLDWQTFDGQVGNVEQRGPDGTVWLTLTAGEPKTTSLLSIDPTTMQWSLWGTLAASIRLLEWHGDQLLAAVDLPANAPADARTGLWRIDLPAQPQRLSAR